MKNKVGLLLAIVMFFTVTKTSYYNKSTSELMQAAKNETLSPLELSQLSALYSDFILHAHAKENLDTASHDIVCNRKFGWEFRGFHKICTPYPDKNDQTVRQLIQKKLLPQNILVDYTNKIKEYEKLWASELALKKFLLDLLDIIRFYPGSRQFDRLLPLAKMTLWRKTPLDKAEVDAISFNYDLYSSARKELSSTVSNVLKKYNQQSTGSPFKDIQLVRELLNSKKLTVDEATDYTKKIQNYAKLLQVESQIREVIPPMVESQMKYSG